MQRRPSTGRGRLTVAAAAAAGLALIAFTPLASQTKNGFDLSAASVPTDKILSGDPPRDGIPSIDDPRFQTAEAADWLEPDDRVLDVEHAGMRKAYPGKARSFGVSGLLYNSDVLLCDRQSESLWSQIETQVFGLR